jgi:hypothetical protein
MRSLVLRLAAVVAAAALLAPAVATAAPSPSLVRDVVTGRDTLGDLPISLNPDSALDPIQDYVQPDTQIEPSIAVNPQNHCNVVTAYQEGRVASGGDATNGYATSFDCGKSWKYGELPGLTHYGQGTDKFQGGTFERGSDAVVAFGPNNTVYANSLIFSQSETNGLRSGMAVNVSKDGGKHWSQPVVFQDDNLGGFNDKNWIVVDNSDAPGHHLGRVYVVWDRVAPVVYNYCDHDCDQLANWLPDLQTVDPVVAPEQGIGAYPMVMQSGALGIALNSELPGVPTKTTDNPDVTALSHQQFIIAPAAGSTPWPAPLAFTPPIQDSDALSNGQIAQRASGGILSAAADPNSPNVYVVWDDGRFRTDGKNDIVLSRSTDEGKTWSDPIKVDPSTPDDKIDRYNAAVAVGKNGSVHVMWRQRDESAPAPMFTNQIDTYYSESTDGGQTWSTPLKVDKTPSRPWYGAFSRDGTFEGDYDQLASADGYTYIVRDQGQPVGANETVPLVKNSATTVTLSPGGKGHQHQRNWVALVQDKKP